MKQLTKNSKNSASCYVGFDPGTVNGAIVVLDLTGSKIVEAVRIGDYDIKYIANLLDGLRKRTGCLENSVVFAENQSMRPGQGLNSNSKLVRCFSYVCGYFCGLGSVVYTGNATEWQQTFSLGGKHGPEYCSPSTEYKYKKKAHCKKANALFGDMPEWQADAILMAKHIYFYDTGLLEV